MQPGEPTVRRVVAAGLGVAVLVLGGAGCGSAPETIDPTGIDGLTVPTPEPDPADFVDLVDNPWLPLEPGATWTYDVSGARTGSRTVSVLDNSREFAGLDATVVRSVTTNARNRIVEEIESYYAQDTSGNVWILGVSGRDGWEAGVDDARATIAMAAEPRHGDGYPAAYVGGRVVRRAEVLDNDASTRTPYGDFDGVVEVEEVTPGSGGAVVLSYAPGIGLVEQDALSGIELELVEHSR